ncbi:MAG: hypothetical protein ACAI34_06700 [Verrucomicrobium sp.]
MNWWTRLLLISSAALPCGAFAQEGAKAEVITFPKPGGSITLQQCVVTKIEPDGVRVSHTAGTAKVPYEYLPEEWKKSVPFDEVAAQKYRTDQIQSAKENAARAEKEQRALYEAEMAKIERTRPRFRPAGTTWIDQEQARLGAAEIVHVMVVSVEDNTLLVEKISERPPPTVDGKAPQGIIATNGNLTKVTYWPTGTLLILKGNLPSDLADDDVFSIQGLKDGTSKYETADGVKKTLRIYDVLRHNAPQ